MRLIRTHDGLFSQGRDIGEEVAADGEGEREVEQDFAGVVADSGLRHGDKASDNAVVRPVFSAAGIKMTAPDCDTRALPVVAKESVG